MKKKILPKYQLGSSDIQELSPGLCVNAYGQRIDCSTGKLIDSLSTNPQSQDFNLDGDGVYRKREITENKNKLWYNSTFETLNSLLDITRLIANPINDAKNSKKEREKLLKARYMTAQYNPYENGINNVPVYMKAGGQTEDKRLAAAILKQGDIKGRKLTPKQRKHFEYVLAGKIPISGHTKDAKKKNSYVVGGINTTGYLPNSESNNNDFNIIPSNVLTMNSVPHDIMALPNIGEPTIMKSNSGKYYFPNADYVTEVPIKQKGGYLKNTVDNNYGKYNGIVNEEGKFIDNPTQLEAIKTMINYMQNNQSDQAPAPSNVYRPEFMHHSINLNLDKNLDYAKYGGSNNIQQVDEHDYIKPNAEVEEGEIIQRQDGSIVKAAEGSGTHEEGGNKQAFVFRVLEDTGDKRNDDVSKLLRITPIEAEQLVGFKPKRTVTHSKLYELAKEYYGSKSKNLEKKLENNFKYVKYSHGGKYAENSLKENLKMVKTIPTDANLFDLIYEHQEQVKQVNSVSNMSDDKKCGGKAKKYQVGGTKIPPYAWDEEKKKYNALLEYAAKVKKLGYTGDTNIGDIQKFMVNNYPELVKDYMTNRGIPNTNKGLELLQKGINDPLQSFNDNLWWYRSMLPEDKTFNSQEEFDTFIKGKTPVKQGEKTFYVDPNDTNYQKIYYNPTLNSISSTSAQQVSPQINSQQDIQRQYKKPEPIIPSTVNSQLGLSAGLGNLLGFIDTARIPVDLEQLRYDPLKVHELNPLPTLLENQGDYSSALEQLPTNGIGFANQANLQAQKYKVNNQVLGQYENINKAKYDAVDATNLQGKMQIDAANLQLRDQFVNRVLTGKEKQRQQKMEFLNGIFKAIDERNAFDRNANLALKLSPFFNERGEFNNNKYVLNNAVDNADGTSVKYITDSRSGDRYRVIYDKDGKLISSSKIITDKKASGN